MLRILEQALKDVCRQAYECIKDRAPMVGEDRIRANIFLLAKTQDDTYRLVVHPRLGVNMNHPPEWTTQLRVGQGAAGAAFRDGAALLTRRRATSQGDWEERFEMDAGLKAVVHKNLKWIVTLPLIPEGGFGPVGVLNIDGLVDLQPDDILESVAGVVRQAVQSIADYLSLQPSTCVELAPPGAAP